MPHPRLLGLAAALLCVCAVAPVLVSRAWHPEAARAGNVLPFSVALDCDPATTGVQSQCQYPSGTTALDVDVVFENKSGAAASLGSFNFDVVTNQQAVLNPAPDSTNAFDSNP